MTGGMSGFWGLQHLRQTATSEVGRSQARTEAGEASRSIRDMQEQVDKLTLINMAMWSMLQDISKFTEQDLLQRVRDLDLMDGIADGRVTRSVAKCPKCDRVMSPKHKKCLYCGFTKLKTSVFDEVT